jgi:hypothetical protein
MRGLFASAALIICDIAIDSSLWARSGADGRLEDVYSAQT